MPTKCFACKTHVPFISSAPRILIRPLLPTSSLPYLHFNPHRTADESSPLTSTYSPSHLGKSFLTTIITYAAHTIPNIFNTFNKTLLYPTQAPLLIVPFLSSSESPYLQHQPVSEQYSPTSYFTNQTKGAVICSPRLRPSRLTNHLHLTAFINNSGVSFILLSTSAFFRNLHYAPFPTSTPPLLDVYFLTRSMCRKYCPG